MSKKDLSPAEMLGLLMNKHGLTCSSLAKDIHLSQTVLRLISIGKGRVTVPVALRLAKYFKTNPEYWLIAQMKYDLSEAARDKELTQTIRGIAEISKKPSAQKPKKGAQQKGKKLETLAAKRKKNAKVPGAKPSARTRKA